MHMRLSMSSGRRGSGVLGQGFDTLSHPLPLADILSPWLRVLLKGVAGSGCRDALSAAGAVATTMLGARLGSGMLGACSTYSTDSSSASGSGCCADVAASCYAEAMTLLACSSLTNLLGAVVIMAIVLTVVWVCFVEIPKRMT
jgi:hypothetical protein